MNICVQIGKFIYKALKFPIYFYTEKKLGNDKVNDKKNK